MNNLETFALDSCKIKIPIQYLKTAPNVFYETVVQNDIVTSNGVVYDNNEYKDSQIVSINRQPISTTNSKKVNSITLSIDKTMQLDAETGKAELKPITTLTVGQRPYNTFQKDSTGKYIFGRMVEFQINSKQLLSNYFNGINGKSITDIYSYMQKCGFEVSEEHFFEVAKLTDTDIKFDMFATTKEYENIVKVYKDSSKSLVGILPPKVWNAEDNKGIQFGGNRQVATITAPFLKLYYKWLEMLINSKQFTNYYLSKEDFENLYRWEFTLIDADHFKKYGIVNTVGNVLNLLDNNQTLFKHISSEIHNIHLNQPNQNNLIVKSKSIDAMEIYQKSLITAYIELGKSDNEILHIILNSLKNSEVSASTIKRHRADINIILQQIAQDKKSLNNQKLIENRNVNLALNKVGFLKS